eukprot:GFUD01030365.1.p1 GENE.GFUD01030365.1~~GFUD01030365.1.p1  ORF type:complete len:186 (+),score=57.17 GFUD01030365.1:54-611(+)
MSLVSQKAKWSDFGLGSPFSTAKNVKATGQSNPGSALVETENKENTVQRLPLVPSNSLPKAECRTDNPTLEKKVEVKAPGCNYTEACDTVENCVNVDQQMTGVKVELGAAGLKWNEKFLVNSKSMLSSPSVARHKAPSKSVLKLTRRDSGLFDESMMKQSVHETRVSKKTTKGKGRGGRRGRGKK